MPKSKMKSRPQVYPRLPFHIIRAIAFISGSIVSGILIFFCVQLRHDGFKLPWTFIIVLAASLLSLLTLLITSIIYACAFLSPLINLLANVTITILWTVGLALLTWNMYGTLGHSCSRANWASDDGMMICRTYKALYSFALFGWLSQIALIVLDIRSRRVQTALGKYNKMAAAAAAADAGRDVKLDSLSRSSWGHDSAGEREVPYGIPDYGDDATRALRGGNQQPPLRMDDFSSYDRYAPQTRYANAGYGYGPR
ncbi:uncharacterized protein Z518_07341 [Rhinocladiella mackenziei CBS 650.93]|uniref:Rhinocladiella mackenziei CBS 650.93 unplaced genomic scaffold supercont1.5, whole genome shotgun sequence n=1 Tax=Rhinocladiella mackenziei CBS 650.93 TaxID=1442369 RepID=A0A0D2H018_9EURO|nr:uncharacterized protein Z518_07341 [Rhinocladiella mackenziei CBS 650.93]KIX03788.1 hypothetical protein Z518_07341 [Rhinocladiella mackenziei CBS 650.93]